MLGARVKELRKKAGLTQVELAERVEVSREYITQIESGKKLNPSRDVLQKLAGALSVPETDLLAALAIARIGNGSLSELVQLWPDLSQPDRLTVLRFVRAMREQPSGGVEGDNDAPDSL